MQITSQKRVIKAFIEMIKGGLAEGGWSKKGAIVPSVCWIVESPWMLSIRRNKAAMAFTQRNVDFHPIYRVIAAILLKTSSHWLK